MYYLGIDPGKSGAAALITSKHQVVGTVKFSETERDISEWFESLDHEINIRGIQITAALEKVHAMPKQGVASSFKFGASYGFCRGMLIAHGIRFEAVTPHTWQKALGCLSKGDKNVTKRKAQELFPHVQRITHAVADALLLAEFARRREGKSSGK